MLIQQARAFHDAEAALNNGAFAIHLLPLRACPCDRTDNAQVVLWILPVLVTAVHREHERLGLSVTARWRTPV